MTSNREASAAGESARKWAHVLSTLVIVLCVAIFIDWVDRWYIQVPVFYAMLAFGWTDRDVIELRESARRAVISRIRRDK